MLRSAFVVTLVLGLTCVIATPASAAAPGVAVIEGHLSTSGGGPVADGSYVVVVAAYATVDAVVPIYQEIHTGVVVQTGLFSLVFGSKKNPADATLFVDGAAQWLGVSVAGEAELPRRHLEPVPYAWRAQVAAAVDCTGCVHKAHLDAELQAALSAAPDLSGYAKLDDLKDFAKASALDGTARLALANVFSQSNTFLSGIGIGKAAAPACAIDIGSDGGKTCQDGAPSLMVRFANSKAEMEKLGENGQIVYLVEDGRYYARTTGVWRQIQMVIACGDGFVEGAEECDAGAKNANEADQCRTTCMLPACGDSIQDGGEQCDDGNEVATDACVACKTATCGDGKIQAGVEQCDDGNGDATDACIGCFLAKCGDGNVQAGVEQCDDGNAGNDDACIACKPATCGDGYVQAGVEECDNGGQNADAPDKCRLSCKNPKCGDGIPDGGEQCDDGNQNDGDACTNACKTTAKYHMNGEFYVSDAVHAGDFNKNGGFCTGLVGKLAYIAGNNASPPNPEAGGTWQGNGSSSNSSTNCSAYSSKSGQGYGVKGGYGACTQLRHVVCSTDPKYCNGYGIQYCPVWD